MFQFRSHRPAPIATPADCSAAADDGADRSASAACRGWFDSSADLKYGLQVQEDDFDSLPPELRDAFPSR